MDAFVKILLYLHFIHRNHPGFKLNRRGFLCDEFAAYFLFYQIVKQLLFYVGYDPQLMDLTVSGFYIFSLSFAFMGYAIFASGFFTALNDGVTSAVISFLRTSVFQCAAVLLLPLIWGIDGVWISIVAAKAIAVVISAIFLVAKRKKYHYF